MCWRRFSRGRKFCILRRRLDDRRIDALKCAGVDEINNGNVHDDGFSFEHELFSIVCWVSHFVATKVTATRADQVK